MHKLYIIGLLYISGITCTLISWYDTGHMIVAQIAYNRLTPQIKMHVDTIVTQSGVAFNVNDNFVAAACWPDDIRATGMHAFDSWHIATIPYDPHTILSHYKKAELVAVLNHHNGIWAINESIKTLKNPQATSWQKGFMLRFLIHCVGDIHQPLHCTSLYNTDFPQGDRGGNNFLIDNPYNNLHGLWDSGFDLCGKKLDRPLDPASTKLLYALVKNITQEFPAENLIQKNDLNPSHWQEESYNAAIHYAYKGIKVHEKPSQLYYSRGRAIASERLALAGYRLANLLTSIFS